MLSIKYLGEKMGKKPIIFIVSLDIYKPTSGEENCISSYFWHTS